MKLTIISIFVSAILLPASVFAMGCGPDHATKQTSSCIAGYVWDQSKSSCVKAVNS